MFIPVEQGKTESSLFAAEEKWGIPQVTALGPLSFYIYSVFQFFRENALVFHVINLKQHVALSDSSLTFVFCLSFFGNRNSICTTNDHSEHHRAACRWEAANFYNKIIPHTSSVQISFINIIQLFKRYLNTMYSNIPTGNCRHEAF